MGHHEFIVVGRGLIGTAATRHLADAGHDVALIGPSEPKSYTGPGPYSSHFDQGRVTRIAAFEEPWGTWAKASIGRYSEIARRSGIEFHDPVGLAVLAKDAERAVAIGADLGADVALLTATELRSRCGIASVVPEHRIAWEGAPAGIINPRALREAQIQCATQAGASIIDDVVVGVDSDGAPVSLTLRSGTTMTADRVLFCTGAYGAEVLGIDLPLEKRLRTIVLAELDDGPDLPTLIIDDPPHPALEEAYWVPPVLWPNGKRLIKIGGDSIPMNVGAINEEIDQWFRDGASSAEADALFELLVMLLPDRQVTRFGHKPCVVSYTPAGVPHITSVTSTISVAFGGCGAGAKSSDELGRLASVELLSD